MNPAQKQNLEIDIHRLVVGDLREMNPMMKLMIMDRERAHTAVQYLCSERTLTELIAAISVLTFDREFSLDVAMRTDTMVTIGVVIYDAPFEIEGLT